MFWLAHSIERVQDVIMDDLQEIFGSNGLLRKKLDNFEYREGQFYMAQAIAKILTGHDEQDKSTHCPILVIEAETGIGKTLAYLIPAVLSGRKVVVSTATLTLQDQIINKDIPLIERILGGKLSVLCVKGRQNYLCLYRWYQYRSGQLTLIEDEQLAGIDKWLPETMTGDRSELAWLPEHSVLWDRISAQSNHCLGGECPEHSSCFVNSMRKLAGGVNLLVVNHHVLFSDLALKQKGFGDLLPRYECVICDEAHHLENVATAFFGQSFSQYQLVDLLRDIERHTAEALAPDDADILLPMTNGLRQRLDCFSQLFPQQIGKFPLQLLIDTLSQNVWRGEIDLLAAGISHLQDKIAAHAGKSDLFQVFHKRCGEIKETLAAVTAPEEQSHDFISWYEKRERSVALSRTPIDVSALLHETLYSGAGACVFTSATLSSGGSFSYISSRLGLDESAHFLRYDSPFDYQRNTLLYVPDDNFPDPSDQVFTSQACGRILELLIFSKGRALVLCTSVRAMESYADFLKGRLVYPVFVQGDGSRSSLLKRFRQEKHSVLLAVASFWEGIDVVGDSLSCVIIDKLPFEVPTDPVLQARVTKIKEEGGNPFFSFQVPRAVLALRQGVGRLMRSATDRGVIVVLDVRLYKKSYGRTFLKSLPPSRITRQLGEVEQFFASNI